MNDDIAIKVDNLSKAYKLYNKPIDRLKEALHPFKKRYHKDFYALNNISFDIKRGETIGIIGKNGSGKSTLLKIITGVLSPSAGKVETNGKISALLELGAGFNPELTGMENIYLNGIMIGYSHEEMELRVPSVVEFADIGDFIYQPVKTYSSGMFVRLAFAVAINIEPDILIVDEALSVGDARFQQKCLRRMKDFQRKGTVLFVSHDIGAIKNFCNRVIWLDEGVSMKDGTPDKICEEYHAYMNCDSKIDFYKTSNNIEYTNNIFEDIDLLENNIRGFGDGSVEIIGANIIDSLTKEKKKIFKGGEKIELFIKSYVKSKIDFPIIGFIIKDRLGTAIVDENTKLHDINVMPLIEDKTYVFKWTFILPKIKDGIYLIDIAIAEGSIESHIQKCWINDALIIEVRKEKKYCNGALLSLEKVEIELFS